MNPVVQLSKQVQYLFIALLFAGFAVTANAVEEGKELSRNKWEIGTRFTQNAVCAGLPVVVAGKLTLAFKVEPRNGRNVIVPITEKQPNGDLLLPKDASNRVGATGNFSGQKRHYKVDRVELEFKGLGAALGSMVMRVFFVAKPNAVNTAQGDLSPGNTFTFRAVYKVEWAANDGRVTSLLSDTGEARCQ